MNRYQARNVCFYSPFTKNDVLLRIVCLFSEVEDGSFLMASLPMTKKAPQKHPAEASSNAPEAVHRTLHEHELQAIEMARYVKPENQVKRIVRRDTQLIHATVAAIILCVLCGILLAIFGFWIIASAIAILGAASSVACHVYFLRHRVRIVKYSIVNQILDKYFHTSLYLASHEFTQQDVANAAILDHWSKARVSDYFVGTWQERKFEFGDLSITGIPDEEEQATSSFSGQLYILDLKQTLRVPILIRERHEPLSNEEFKARKNSDRFFLTGDERFDRQFEVKIGDTKRASGFEATSNGMSPDEQRKYAHSLIDPMTSDLIAADAYASSRTILRFIHDKLYIAIENTRDTFELQRGDENHLDLLQERFEDETRAMATYLDYMTRALQISKL